MAASTRSRVSGFTFGGPLLITKMNYEIERRMLRDPSDEDLEVLRADPNLQPEVAIEGQKQRVQWALDTERVLKEHPKCAVTGSGMTSALA